MKKIRFSAVYAFGFTALFTALSSQAQITNENNHLSAPGFAVPSPVYNLSQVAASQQRQDQLLTESFQQLKENTANDKVAPNHTKFTRSSGCVETLAQNGKIIGTISSNLQPAGAYVAQMPNKKVALVYKNKNNAHLKTNDSVAVAGSHCDKF